MQIFRTGRLNDKRVLKLVEEFIGKLGRSGGHLKIAGKNIPYDTDHAKALFDKPSNYMIDAVDISSDDNALILRFRRGIGGQDQNLDQGRTASPFYDEIAVDAQRNPAPSAERIVDCLALVQKHLAIPEAATNDEALGLLTAQYAQLNGLFTELTESGHKRILELDKLHANRLAELSEKERLLEEGLTHRRAELEQEYQDRSSDLLRREEDLNNRAHMHARRTLGKEITDKIQERLEEAMLPRRTSIISWGIFLLTLLGAVGLSWVAYFSLTEFATLVEPPATTPRMSPPETNVSPGVGTAATFTALLDSPLALFLLLRGTLSGFASVGFLVYAISWLKAIYHDDVRARRELSVTRST
ncbi:hypothetical protein [Sinorhizobium meliloti]|uniref:hypothetical protein n=1 Tax=Rhizobium meliloti TaxID=382 RepID=UPI000FD8B034|nr:hypothetical protein [Sinorhizobium meliloti]MDW9473484.1 hypothetical protein [Sinorhizobium meliloti]RVI81718.1 hypothetical protein CN188_13680 [Sinorhizobium meliloti]RVP20672.1 hypothetical protein CN080_21585 [Sinorhizobium meliloti]